MVNLTTTIAWRPGILCPMYQFFTTLDIIWEGKSIRQTLLLHRTGIVGHSIVACQRRGCVDAAHLVRRVLSNLFRRFLLFPYRSIFIPRPSTLHWRLFTDIHSKIWTAFPSSILLSRTLAVIWDFRHYRYFRAWSIIALYSKAGISFKIEWVHFRPRQFWQLFPYPCPLIQVPLGHGSQKNEATKELEIDTEVGLTFGLTTSSGPSLELQRRSQLRFPWYKYL